MGVWHTNHLGGTVMLGMWNEQVYLSSKHVHVGNEHVGNIRQKLQFDDLPAIYINLLHICGDLPAIS